MSTVTPPTQWPGSWLGFPPGRGFILLPAGSPRAARAGLDLYDAVARRQTGYLVACRTLLRAGIERPFAFNGSPALPDYQWWQAWLADMRRYGLASVRYAAFRLLGGGRSAPDRYTCLLLDDAGVARAFAKLWPQNGPERAASVSTVVRVASGPQREFSVPGVIGVGEHDGVAFLLQTPLPAGGHRRMSADPARLRAVILDLQERLSRGVVASSYGHVPVHGSLTPLNLREDRQGRLWLVDWDKVTLGPSRSDELRYWISDLARRGWGPGERRARRIIKLMATEPTSDAIREALRWRAGVRPREVLRAEQDIRDALTRQSGLR